MKSKIKASSNIFQFKKKSHFKTYISRMCGGTQFIYSIEKHEIGFT